MEHKVLAPWEICTLLVYADLKKINLLWWKGAVKEARKYNVVFSHRRDRNQVPSEAVAWRIALRGQEQLIEAVENFLRCVYKAEDASGAKVVEPEDCARFPCSQALTGFAHVSK